MRAQCETLPQDPVDIVEPFRGYGRSYTLAFYCKARRQGYLVCDFHPCAVTVFQTWVHNKRGFLPRTHETSRSVRDALQMQ